MNIQTYHMPRVQPTFLLLLAVLAHSQLLCPQLCPYDCTSSQICNGCYDSFLASAPLNNPNCSCPTSMFTNSGGYCQPCPIRCLTCTNTSQCTSCIPGYMISNSFQCIPNTTNWNGWVSKNVSTGWLSPSLMGNSPLTIQDNGSTINITSTNLGAYSSSCPNLGNSSLLGGFNLFSYSSVVLKTIYNLPPHQWINIRFQVFLIDFWQDNTLLLEINNQENYNPDYIMSPTTIWSGSFNSSQRFADFCGSNIYPDNLAVVDAWTSHASSMAKLQIRLNSSNMSFGANSSIMSAFYALGEVLIRVGTCGRNCQSCSSPYQCTQCYPPYIAVNGSCVCDSANGVGFATQTGCSFNCHNGQYYNSTAMACIDCFSTFPNCRLCDSSSCITCKMGFFYYLNPQGIAECLQACPATMTESRNTWINTTNLTTNSTVSVQRDECIACPANCLTCNYNICLFCSSGFKYYQGACQSTCPPMYYSNLGVCQPCSVYGDCLNCTSSSCTICSSGLQFTNGRCSPICNSANSNCSFNCSSPCSTCFGPSSTQCLSCSSGVLSGSTCISNCAAGQFLNSLSVCQNCPYGCSACDNLTCSSCIPGFYLSNSTACLRICPSGYYPETYTSNVTVNLCGMCSPGCTRCISSSFCLRCQSGLTLFNFQCSSTQQNYYEWNNGSFLRCPSYCITCRHRVCSRCDSGWVLDQGECRNACPSNKYVDTITVNFTNGSIEYVHDVCKWKDPLCQLYNSNGSSCSLCSFTFPAAVPVWVSSVEKCTLFCPQFYTKDANLSCQSCPNNCRRCLADLTCIKCLDNYVINYPALLNSSNLMTDSCILNYCPPPYFTDSLQCQRCPFGCNTCLLDGSCFICEAGFTLDPNTKICHESTCSLSQYNSTNNGSCVSCAPECLSCHSSAVNCTACPPPMGNASATFLTNQQCLSACPNGYFGHIQSRTCRKCDPRCAQCSSFRNCTACQHNFYLLSFYDNKHTPCVPECPIGFYADQNYVCQRCFKDCKSCYGPSEYQCLTCYPNFHLDQGKCTFFCSAMKYADLKSGHCEWCHPSCQECWGPTRHQCLSCLPNNYIYNHQCFPNSCPGATFLSIPSQRLCEPCQFGCQYCSSSQFCYFCTPGYHFYQGWCYLNCPGNLLPIHQRYYLQLLGTICEGCSNQYSSNCQVCSLTSCQKCQGNLFLLPNSSQTVSQLVNGVPTNVIEQCFATCPSGTFGRVDNGRQCISCSINCINCTSYSSCQACASGFNLVNGYCTVDCPQGTYNSSGNCPNCPTNCTSCQDLAHCTSCKSGLFLSFSPTLNITTCVTSCPTTYYADVSGWCFKCHTNCVFCVNATSCSQCKSGYSLSNGVCVNTTNNTCINNCAECVGGVCYQCHYPFLLYTNETDGMIECIASCPQGYYTSAFHCLKCNATCASCNNTANNCTSCVSGLYGFKHKCISACPVGYYADSISQRCLPCPQNCLNCHNSTCIVCVTGYYLYMDVCYMNCPVGTFPSLSSQMCFSCSNNCSACLDLQNCTECLSSHYLFNSTCLTECPQTTFMAPSGQGTICKPCVSPCYRCIDSTKCLSCSGGYILNGTICQQGCSPGYYIQSFSVNYTNSVTNQNFTIFSQCHPCSSQCLTCSNSSTNCISCPSPLILHSRSCLAQCPDGTLNLVGSCVNCPPSCLKCSDQSTCTICISGAVLFNGECRSGCPQGYFASALTTSEDLSYVCTPCSSNCKTCNGDSEYDCLTCSQNYYFYQGMCLSSCPAGFYPNPITRSCELCPSACTLCSSASNCSQCQLNFTLSSTRQCVADIPEICNLTDCITCSASNASMCQQCATGYSVFNGTCVSTCPQSFYSFNSRCLPCGVNCSNCSATGCSICLNGTYLFNGICYSACPSGTIASGIQCIPDPCLYYDANYPYGCLSCASPQVLAVTNSTTNFKECLSSCPSGTVESNGHCLECPFNCLSCVSAYECTVCQNGTYLYEEECEYICPVGTYADSSSSSCLVCPQPFCLHCSNATTCSLCDEAAQASLSNGVCVINCPLGTYRDNQLSECINCTSICLSCLNSSYCTGCDIGYYLYQGQCLTSCPPGTYLSNSSCISCPSGCYSCNSSANCTSCDSALSLLDISSLGSCVSTCPSGYYSALLISSIFLNTNYYECLPCSSPCVTCSVDSTSCTSCVAGYSLSGTNCLTTCQNGYYPIIEVSTSFFGLSFQLILCFPCSPNCLTCSSWSTCTSCHSGMILDQDGNCLSGCPSSDMYYDSSTRQCLQCSSACYSCNGPLSSNCISCLPPLQLYQGTCLSGCPFGHYSTTSYICQPCNSNCADCANSSTNCTVCQEGTFLHFNNNGLSVCTIECGSGFYPDLTASICQNCNSSCLNCSGPSSSQCTACPSGFVLWQGQCLSSCPSGTAQVVDPYQDYCISCNQNCQECSHSPVSGLSCFSCQGNFFLINGTCQTSCPVGTYPSLESSSCINCGISGCQTCIFNSSLLVQCTTCQSGFLFVSDQLICVPTCPANYVQSGSRCNPVPVCTQYNYNGYCLSSCPQGTYPVTVNSSSTCMPCTQNCIICSSAASCSQCNNVTVLFSSNGTVQCLSYCPLGYFNASGVCTLCPSNCSSCVFSVTYGEPSCQTCMIGTYLLDGQCLSVCPPGYYQIMSGGVGVCDSCAPNCAQCSVLQSNCTVCKSVNYLTPDCLTQNCSSNQYQLVNGSCANCHSLCASCYGSAGYECLTCVNGSFMLNGQCLSTCPSAFVELNGTCIPCPSNCQICLNSSTCSQCTTGHFLDSTSLGCVSDCSTLNTVVMTFYASQGNCLPCSTISNCQDCSYQANSSLQCTGCQSGSYLYQGSCLNPCPVSTYNTTTNCIDCPANCSICSASGCSQCALGWVLLNGQCSSSCPNDQYLSTTGNSSVCLPCGANCQNCSASACFSCAQPYALVNGSCSGCVSGYFWDTGLNLCSKCSSECSSCVTTGTTCTNCSGGFMLMPPSTCTSACPSGYYPLNNVCTACSVYNCASCPNDQCQYCSTGFVMLVVNGTKTCSSSCPPAYFQDSVSNFCHACSVNCDACTSATSCTTCNNATSLYLGYCLTTCPSGYAPVGGICTRCLSGCKVCPSIGNCSACNSGLSSDGNGTCSPANTTVNCSSGYYPNTLGNCSQCYPTCQTCSGGLVTDCLTCFSGSTLTNGVCITNCNADQFFNTTSSSCQLCSSAFSNCASCSQTSCTSCTTNYTLIGGLCALTCPNGTYLYNQQCLTCSSFCLTCTSSTNCIQCITSNVSSIFLYNGACHTTCPQQTYSSGGSCLPCDQTCLTCSGSPSNCSSCLNPYSLNGNTCVISCPNGTYSDTNFTCANCSMNCLLCSGVNTCSSCDPAFYLVNGSCRSNCTAGYYIDAVSNRCLQCVSPCTQCSARTNCSACESNWTLTGSVCLGQCVQGQYFNSSFSNCTQCPLSGCGVCTSSACQTCSANLYAYYSNGVLVQCAPNCTLQSTYADNSTMECLHCYTNCLICDNAIFCTRCDPGYYLMTIAGNNFNQCLNICPLGYFQFIDANNILPPACLPCSTNCNSCLNATYCQACQSHFFRFTTQNPNNATNVTCVNQCPAGYSTPTIISGVGMCGNCGTNCALCTDSATCTQCISSNFVILSGVCTPFNCLNCANCNDTANICFRCVPGYFLHNNGCTSYCPNGYYGDSLTGTCVQCLANCDICFNGTSCSQCISGYIFVSSNVACENQGFVQFGTAGNMSGFTSNITQIMATTYVATSAGPIAFGALTNTYGAMQVCQFMYLMAGSADNNPELVTFLDSMSICSYTNSGNTTANSTATGRRLTGIAYTDSFLTTSIPIFIIMGCFTCAYIVVLLFEKYQDSCCTSCPCIQKYMKYTCRFMERRFRYIYLDLVMWISYLPFLYFGLLQVKNLRWDTGLNIFSNLLAFVILLIYPLYPIFILRKIFDKSDVPGQNLKNYYAITLKVIPEEDEEKALCEDVKCCPREDPNTALAEMSLSPWIDSVERPVYNLNMEGYDEFRYFTVPHFRLAIAAIKYFRKFLFVLFVALISSPVTTLACLVGLSVAYLLYLFILRPKKKLFLILEIILELLILAFEIFMLVYVVVGGATVTVMSVVAHAVGFAMANSTLVIGIILNILAYYTIFCCIIDCVKHLKESAEHDDMEDNKQIESINEKDDEIEADIGEYYFPDQPFDSTLEKFLVKNFDGDQRPEELVANLDMEKDLVRDFGRIKDDYVPVIPVDLQKKLVHEYRADVNARDLIKNTDLEKSLVRNIGRTDEDHQPVIPYDLEKQLVRDFDGQNRPEELVKNQDLEKDLVRNFARDKFDPDHPEPVIPYSLEKQIVRDFGGEQRPEELVQNNDLDKKLVRNFARTGDDQLPVIDYNLQKKLVRDFGGQNRPQQLVMNTDLEKELVKNFGKSGIDELPIDYIDVDLEKQLIRQFGGDEHPEELVLNNDLEKKLVRNIGRKKDGEDYEDSVIPYDLEKQLVRDFGNDRPEELVQNQNLEKDLVRNFARNKVDDFSAPAVEYDLEKQLVRDFGGDDRPEQLVGNYNMEKDLVRNFGRKKAGDDLPPTVIDYNLEKKIIKDFGGDDRPQMLIKNSDLDKEIVRNIGRKKDGDDYPETVIPYKLEKQIVRNFGGDQHPEDLVSNALLQAMIEQFIVKKQKSSKQIDEDELTQENNYDEVPLAQIRFSQGHQRLEDMRNKQFKQYDQYVEMPALKPTIIKSNKHIEDETPVSTKPEESKQKSKKDDRKDKKAQPRVSKKAFGLDEEEYSSGAFIVPSRQVKELDELEESGSDRKFNININREQDPFGQFEEVVEPKKAAMLQSEKRVSGQKPKHLLEEDIGEVTAKEKLEKYKQKQEKKRESQAKGYEDVVNKHKEQVFKPNLEKLGDINFDNEQLDDYSEEKEVKRDKRRQRSKSRKRESDEESRSMKKRKNSSQLMLNKQKGGNLLSNEELELDDDNVSHDSRRSKLLKARVNKEGLLNIDDRSHNSDQLDQINF